MKSYVRRIDDSLDIYDLAFEVRSKAKGDPSGETGQAIENAATQVSRSLSGFIQAVYREPRVMEGYEKFQFLPVIFTTANLYITTVDLSRADLRTGRIELSNEDVKAVPWLVYQYPLSPSLRHRVPTTMSEALHVPFFPEYEYLRTVPIVGPNGIEEFFGWVNKLDELLVEGEWVKS